MQLGSTYIFVNKSQSAMIFDNNWNYYWQVVTQINMGAEQSKEKSYLKVANINFSGNQLSPFQYYSEDHILEEQQLNSIFQKQFQDLRKKHKKEGSFNQQSMKKISKIDKVLKVQRYSPLYHNNCGVLKGRFINEEEFKQAWYLMLQQAGGWEKLAPKGPKNAGIKYTFEKAREDYKVELQVLLKFDYCLYISILQYVYENNQIDNIIKDRSCSKYLGFMESFFSKSFLNKDKKTLQVIRFIEENDIDILFMQEATQKFCGQLEKLIQNYRCIRSKPDDQDPGYSLVIFRQSSFKYSHVGRKGNLKLLQIFNDKKMDEKVKQNFLVWGKSAVISIDNFLLISTHTKQYNKQMQGDLKLIQQKFPTKYVIVGGTLSKGYPRERGNQQQYQIFPIQKVTCFKKRTNMQFQEGKANKIVAEQSNFILYDTRLKVNQEGHLLKNINNSNLLNGIYTINLVEVDENLKQNANNNSSFPNLQQIGFLPNQQHLFDQLIVIKTLQIPKKKKKYEGLTKPELKKIKEERERLGFQTSSSEEEGVNNNAINNQKNEFSQENL